MEAQIAAIDADLKVYELALEHSSRAIGEIEAANLISYGMTTVEPGVDLLGLVDLSHSPAINRHTLRRRSIQYAIGCAVPPGPSAVAEDDHNYDDSLSWLANGATRDIAAIFGAIVAARMAGIRVVLAGEAACKARICWQR